MSLRIGEFNYPCDIAAGPALRGTPGGSGRARVYEGSVCICHHQAQQCMFASASVVSDTVYVAENGNHRVQKVIIREGTKYGPPTANSEIDVGFTVFPHCGSQIQSSMSVSGPTWLGHAWAWPSLLQTSTKSCHRLSKKLYASCRVTC